MFYRLKKYIIKRKNKKNVSAARDIVIAVYQEFLGRTPTEEEVYEWTERLIESGFNISFRSFFNAVANSEEIRNRFFIGELKEVVSTGVSTAKNYYDDSIGGLKELVSGVKDIAVDDIRLAVEQDIARAVIGASYEEFLNRKPAEKEVSYWFDAVINRKVTYGGFFNALSNAVFKSSETAKYPADGGYETDGQMPALGGTALDAHFGEVVDKFQELLTGERFNRGQFEKIMKIRNSGQIVSDRDVFALKYAFEKLNPKKLNPKKIIYFHIPKCAGNSVMKFFERSIDKDDMLRFNVNGFLLDDDEWLGEWNFLLGFAKFISVAHCDLDLCLKIPGNNTIVSFFREPESRLLSSYYYFKSHGLPHIASIPKHRRDAVVLSTAKTDNLANFLKSDNPYVLNNIDNNITRCLTGFFARSGRGGSDGGYYDELHKNKERTLAIALNNLEKIDLIGIMEKFDSSLELFSKVLGLKPPEADSYSENVTEKNIAESSFYEKVQKEPIDEEIKKDLTALTELDKIVYERALAIYNEQLKSYK